VDGQWITEFLGGLQIVEVTNRSSPVTRATVDGLSVASAAVADDVLYGASLRSGWRAPYPPLDDGDPFTGLVVLDLAQPSKPDRIGEQVLDGNPQDVAVAGRFAFLANDTAGLQVVDVSDPASPSATGRLTDTYGNAKALVVSDDTALVAVSEPGATRVPGGSPGALSIVDVSDAAQPMEVGRLALDQPAFKVASSGDYGIVADRYGVTLIDVSDPGDPKWLDRFVPSDVDPDLLPRIISVDAAGQLVYVAVDPSSVFVLELTEGPLPTPSVPPTGIPTATPMPTETPTTTPTPDEDATATPTPTSEVAGRAYIPMAYRQ
jgi:hypothetical protein